MHSLFRRSLSILHCLTFLAIQIRWKQPQLESFLVLVHGVVFAGGMFTCGGIRKMALFAAQSIRDYTMLVSQPHFVFA